MHVIVKNYITYKPTGFFSLKFTNKKVLALMSDQHNARAVIFRKPLCKEERSGVCATVARLYVVLCCFLRKTPRNGAFTAKQRECREAAFAAVRKIQIY